MATNQNSISLSTVFLSTNLKTACVERLARPSSDADACGHAVDRATDQPGVEVFRARWRDLAREGFCVLPAERFVVGQ